MAGARWAPEAEARWGRPFTDSPKKARCLLAPAAPEEEGEVLFFKRLGLSAFPDDRQVKLTFWRFPKKTIRPGLRLIAAQDRLVAAAGGGARRPGVLLADGNHLQFFANGF